MVGLRINKEPSFAVYIIITLAFNKAKNIYFYKNVFSLFNLLKIFEVFCQQHLDLGSHLFYP